MYDVCVSVFVLFYECMMPVVCLLMGVCVAWGGNEMDAAPHLTNYTIYSTDSHKQKEWLALGALMEGHYPLALSALDKADTPPAGTKEVGGERERCGLCCLIIMHSISTVEGGG